MRARRDRGSATVELVLAAPVFALLLGLVIAAGRTQAGRADVEAAAHASARTITLAREPASAVGPARATAETMLRVGSPTCRSMGWDVQIDETAATVRVSCTVDLSEAALLPLPGTFTVDATATEVFDVWTERQRED